MSEQLSIVPVKPEVKFDNVIELSERYLPDMHAGSAKAVAAMKEIEVIEDDKDREYANNVLVHVRSAYTKINGWRTEITQHFDELKKKFMEYERPLGDDKNSEYTRVRHLIATYDQEKIDKRKKLEEDAARKKERENHLVDIGAAILTNLSNLVLAKTKKGDEDSAAYFKAATLEDFDERAEKYKKMKPNLKTEEYLSCLEVPYKRMLFNEAEMKDIKSTIAKVETFEKWNQEVINAATPIINEWKAKIPELKQNLINLKNASDQSERDRIAAEQAARAKEEEDRRRQSIQQQHADTTAEIANQAELSKLENSFVEQAVVQQAGEAGPVKYVLKFTDHKTTLPALTKIMYHCMSHKDFPGIQKLDKNKKPVFDAKGRPEYIDAIQYWINFFLSKCDIHIDGTVVTEDAKVIVKK